jgi:hypothetical protein
MIIYKILSLDLYQPRCTSGDHKKPVDDPDRELRALMEREKTELHYLQSLSEWEFHEKYTFPLNAMTWL